MTSLEIAELRALGKRLIAMADREAGTAQVCHSSTFVEAARKEMNRRRSRQAIEDEIEIGDAGWDILLDLYVMEAFERKVSISSASLVAAIPATTGLRYVERLVKGGFAYREEDQSDARRTYLRLTILGKEIAERAMKAAIDAESRTLNAVNPRSAGQSALAADSVLKQFSAEAFSKHRSTMAR